MNPTIFFIVISAPLVDLIPIPETAEIWNNLLNSKAFAFILDITPEYFYHGSGWFILNALNSAALLGAAVLPLSLGVAAFVERFIQPSEDLIYQPA